MKFRDKEVSGFFVVHSKENGVLLSRSIERRLETLNADMLDVQYSTHLDLSTCRVINDVLVMYTERKPGHEVIEACDA